MLTYSKHLRSSIDSIIRFITVNDNYRVVGSFARESLYITDVDINNDINNQPIKQVADIIRDRILNLPGDIIFVYLTSGFDPRITPPWEIETLESVNNYNYEKAREFLKDLLSLGIISKDEKYWMNDLLTKNPVVNNLLLIEDKIYNRSKIRWLLEDIRKGFKVINGQKTSLLEAVKSNDQNVLHFIYKYGDNYVPIDVGLNKKLGSRGGKLNKYKYLTYLKKEYYYILADLKKYFRKDRGKYNRIDYIVNKMFGPYKQVLMDLFYLYQLTRHRILKNEELVKFGRRILSKIDKYLDYDNDRLLKEFTRFLTDLEGKYYDLEVVNKLEQDILDHLNKKLKPFAYDYFFFIRNKSYKPEYHYLAFDNRLYKS